MPVARDFASGAWRAVPVLGLTQIIAWGTIYYTPVLMVPLIAAERGFSFTLGMGGFSAALLTASLLAPTVGGLIDRHGGHRVMPFGSLAGAVGLFALTHASHVVAYYATWMLLGAAMAASLYDPAFAALGRIFGGQARSPITALTLIGGFASTVSWPLTYLLLQHLGWKGTYLAYAALLALVAAPLHAFALPRTRAETGGGAGAAASTAGSTRPARGAVFLLVIAAFAAYAFVPSGLSAHLLAILRRAGIDPATAVFIGALFGPAQVGARLCELVFARNVHPLVVARFAVALLLTAFLLLALLGFSAPVAILFAVMFGVANGLSTIARGAVPLALFGAAGYGRIVGRIAAPSLIVIAIAPMVVAFMAERVSDAAALGATAGFAALSLACFLLVRR